MSTENDRNREKKGLFVQGRSLDIDSRIGETVMRLTNTKAFLERVAAGEDRTRDHIAETLKHIERELRDLHTQRERKDPRERPRTRSLPPFRPHP